MKKLQYALLLGCLVGLLAALPAPLVDADEKKSEAETHTVFRPDRDKATQRVKAKIFPLFNKLVRGERCPVAIELSVENGWHINANPANPDYLIPTGVTFKSGEKIRVRKTVYPKHKLHTMPEETEPYHVYDGKVMVYCVLEVNAREKKDEAKLEFSIRYQACNDEQCEKPRTIVMKGKLPVANPGDDIRMIFKDKFPDPAKDGAASGLRD